MQPLRNRLKGSYRVEIGAQAWRTLGGLPVNLSRRIHAELSGIAEIAAVDHRILSFPESMNAELCATVGDQRVLYAIDADAQVIRLLDVSPRDDEEAP